MAGGNRCSRTRNAESRLCAPNREWRWTNVRASPVHNAKGDIEKWVGMNINIDARKSAEAALRENEEQQTFQLQVSDALASLTDPADIQTAAARLVAGNLGVGWCYFNEFDDRGTHATVLGVFHGDGLASMKGLHDLSGERDFLDLMRSEAMLDMPDLTSSEYFSEQAKAAYGALGMRSALGAPLLRGGRLAAVLLVADTSVRRWAHGESELLKGVAERTWAAIERARVEAALNGSEQRQAFLLKLSDALRDEPTSDAIASRAVRMLYDQMGLNRCYIGLYRLREDIGELGPQVHTNEALSPASAQIRLSDFPKALEIASDKTLVINDVMEMEGFTDADRANLNGSGLSAFLTATMRKGKDKPLWAIVAGSMAPRAWSQNEILLVKESAERTWAAIQREDIQAALRENEDRQRILVAEL